VLSTSAVHCCVICQSVPQGRVAVMLLCIVCGVQSDLETTIVTSADHVGQHGHQLTMLDSVDCLNYYYYYCLNVFVLSIFVNVTRFEFHHFC